MHKLSKLLLVCMQSKFDLLINFRLLTNKGSTILVKQMKQGQFYSTKYNIIIHKIHNLHTSQQNVSQSNLI